MVSPMPRPLRVPRELIGRPFSLDEATQAGVSRRQLQGASWERWGARTYAAAGLEATVDAQLQAVLHRLPPGAVFSGRTAAWIYGLDQPPCSPIEVTVPQSTGVWARAGIAVRRANLGAADVAVWRNHPVTAPVRTAADLGRRLPLVEAVVALDQALHAQLLVDDDIRRWIAGNAGRRGVRRLRERLELAQPAAESPMETRLRVLLVRAGLPRPQSQVEIFDHSGAFIGRVDLYYPGARLAIEYDGDNHRERLQYDLRRQNRLIATGLTLLRFTAADVLGNPASVVAQVRAALQARKQAPAP